MSEPEWLARTLAAFTPGAVGVWTGVVLIAFRLLTEWRETRKLSSEDRLARREGYAAQVASLSTENRNLRADLVANEKLHTEYRHACQNETDSLRDDVRRLEDEVTGLRRALTAGSAAAARLLGPGVLSDFALHAAERTASIISEADKGAS